MNWRCPRNPRAGGAEAVTFEIARRLVKRGDSVEWFSANFRGAAEAETIDGIKIVRGGRQWTVHWSAFRRYRTRLSRDFDVVIDEVNTIPFFTPLWADVPQVMFIHQLAREVWWYESVFPLSAVGYVAEPLYLRLYRHLPVLTVSTSTKQDLCRLGFRSSVTIIPEGLEPIADIKTVKPAEPTFVYVGRMAPSKRIEHILAAFAMFREATGRGQLRLIGTGPSAYRGSLERLARRLRVDGHIEFSGRVSTADKHRLMAESHLLLMTSVREGWGLVVTEANACGTPAIVYDVPGLRDSVRNESTGLVVSPRPERLADAMIRLIYDHALYNRLAKEARIWSKTFSFDEAARLWAEALEKTLAA